MPYFQQFYGLEVIPNDVPGQERERSVGLAGQTLASATFAIDNRYSQDCIASIRTFPSGPGRIPVPIRITMTAEVVGIDEFSSLTRHHQGATTQSGKRASLPDWTRIRGSLSRYRTDGDCDTVRRRGLPSLWRAGKPNPAHVGHKGSGRCRCRRLLRGPLSPLSRSGSARSVDDVAEGWHNAVKPGNGQKFLFFFCPR